jgi:hypothetical protein
MRRNWFSKLLGRLSAPRAVRRAGRCPSARPQLEVLEDRCLLSSGPPYALPLPTVGSVDQVLYNGVSGTYEKTITITNNSPTQTIYPFLEGQNSHQAVSPYQGTAQYDPFDPVNQEYRGYIGYTDGTNNVAGLPPLTSFTIPVPLVFWDSGRILFSTDGADQFTTHNGVDGGSPPGAPFYYHDTNTQAIFYCSIDSSHLDQLAFTPVYNSFDPQNGGMPTTTNWQSPVASGLLKDGQSFVVTGPGLPASGYQVTVDSSHPGYIALPGMATAAQTAQQYVFTCLSQQSISPTDRYIQNDLPLTKQGSSSTTNGLVMWYHALSSQAPNNDAPFQLTEITFRGTFYDPTINTGTGFQYLMTTNDFNGAKTDSADYDVSFVDSINMPVAMEATNVPVPNTNTPPEPFGYVGSGQSLEDFQKALATFTSNNPSDNFLGSYFDGKGYPSYVNIDPGNLKLPSGQNVFLSSPAVPSGVSDIQFYKTFPDGSFILEPLYALTTGGTGPSTLSIGGAPGSSGQDLYLSAVNLANRYILNDLIAPNFHQFVVTYNGGHSLAGMVTGLLRDNENKVIGVILDRDVPADAGSQVYNFTPPVKDYAGSRIAGLWYSWAKYYADNVQSTPLNQVSGTISAGNLLTLDQPAPGLVPGMTVTGKGVPAGCVILAIAPDQKTITLSEVVNGNATSFNFARPAFDSIVGFDPDPEGNTPPVHLSFNAAQQAYALAFAETVYVVMSAWSVSVKPDTPNGWNPLLLNIIGGNLGTDYLPSANTDVRTVLTNLSKSALRGVPDFTSPLYSNPALWYPDPAFRTGGQIFNVYNLNPFVWFVHDKLGVTAYAFALDDDVGNVNAGGATNVAISVGGLNGLPKRDPYTNVSPWGVVTTGASDTQAGSSELDGLTNPKVVYQIAQFDYNHDTPGTLVNGPGVPVGTTAQFTQISQDLPQSKIILSNPLTTSSTTPTFSFFGPLTFTGTVLGIGQRRDTIILKSPDAYCTLLKVGPLQNIQVTGEGIDPMKTVTVKELSRDPKTGIITVQLSSDLDGDLVSQPGGFYAYTFGSPVVPLIRDPGFEWANVEGLAGKFNHGEQLTQNTVDWTFTDSPTQPQTWFAGIAFNNDSDYTTGNPPAPEGLQVGFVQGDSSISQTVTLGQGTYTFSLYAAQSARNQTPQSLNVLVDGTPVGTIEPKDTTYELSTVQFTVGAGKHTITFQGTQMSDSTVLIDEIACQPAPALTRGVHQRHPAAYWHRCVSPCWTHLAIS